MPQMPNLQPGDLLKIVRAIKPTALLGAAAQAQVQRAVVLKLFVYVEAFNADILHEMGALNERPIIFALSNPTVKAECTAAQAYEATDGRCVFASGSPFPDWVSPSGKVFYPGQGNNAYVFPGVALAVIRGKISHVTDEHFLTAAKVGTA
jgi:malic enzyme